MRKFAQMMDILYNKKAFLPYTKIKSINKIIIF